MANTILGKVSVTPRGEYQENTSYEPLDVVAFNGGSFMALRDVMGVTPVDGADWMQIAKQGETGPQGKQGIQGPQGDKPVRGVDYWTAEDRAPIEEATQNANDAARNGVRTDAAQELSEAQQATARGNIAAASSESITELKSSLGEDHAIYQDLTDADEMSLLDVNGDQMQGRVLFADAEDVDAIRKAVAALETCFKEMISLALNIRVAQMEKELSELQEHALLDTQ